MKKIYRDGQEEDHTEARGAQRETVALVLNPIGYAFLAIVRFKLFRL